MTQEKADITSDLAQVVLASLAWHSSGGWHCDRCDTPCGASVLDLCGCCETALADSMTRRPE